MEIDPAWLLACTALVLLMTPGLAIFYGGMLRSTGVLNMIMMCFISIPVVTIAWLVAGYALAFGDYAGGLVVEIVSGSSALALALVLGPRIGFKSEAMRPHNLPFVLLGVGLRWFGWFGFNAGSALTADGKAAVVFLNTLIAGCLGMLGWIAVERIRDGRPTTFGAASGVVAGLVAITRSCGFVSPIGAFVVGLAAGVVCSFAVGWKFKAGYDNSLDVVGVHFVGGVVGTFLIRLLAAEVVSGGVEGMFHGGGLSPAGQADSGHPGRRSVRLRCLVRHREGDRQHTGIPRSARGRDLRNRSRSACGDRLHRGRPRSAAQASRHHLIPTHPPTMDHPDMHRHSSQ